jgi:hypothetical protein
MIIIMHDREVNHSFSFRRERSSQKAECYDKEYKQKTKQR